MYRTVTGRWASLVTVVVIAVAAGACAPDVMEPFPESFTQLDAEPQFSHSGAGESARGHVDVGVDARYSFTARRHVDRDGIATLRGQFQVFSNVGTEAEGRAHGEVTCMTVQPDGTARLGGVITHGEGVFGSIQPGVTAFWEVRDNGEGHGVQDDATPMAFGAPPEDVDLFCAEGFGIPTTPSARGNVQVSH